MKKLKDDKNSTGRTQNNVSHLFPNKSGKDAGQTFEINLTNSGCINLDSLMILWSGSGSMCDNKPEHLAEHLF